MLGVGLVAAGLGSVAVGVGVALAVALGPGLALAVADGLGVAAAPMTDAFRASVVPAPATGDGRLAHALAALIGVVLDARTPAAPREPLDTIISPAATPNEARPKGDAIGVTPPCRCRPERRRRCFVP